MRAIAERLIYGTATAAKGDTFPARRYRYRVSLMIQQFDPVRRFHPERPVVQHFNGNVCHIFPLTAQSFPDIVPEERQWHAREKREGRPVRQGESTRMTIDLSGKAALVTGGTRGIGRAISQKLAECGADLALFYRSDESAAKTARDEIAATTGRRVETYRVDVADEAAVEAGVGAALADFGGALPIVIHNAGGGDGGGRMPAIRTDQWRGVLGVNLDAAFYLTRALLAREGALPPGSSVVFIASGAGHDPIEGLAAYGAAKAGLIHFAAVLAQDAGPRGVRVNVVSPGFTDTGRASEERKRAAAERAALRRWGTADDVAGAVLFFASDLSGFVTGQWLRVNGGAV